MEYLNSFASRSPPKIKCSLIMLLFLVTMLILPAESVVTTKRIKFKGINKFRFLAKFAIGEGKFGKFSARARLIKPFDDHFENYPIRITFYDSERWDMVLSSDD